MSLGKRYLRDHPDTTRRSPRGSWPQMVIKGGAGSSNLASSGESISSSGVAGTDGATATFGSCICCLGVLLVAVVIVVHLALGPRSAGATSPEPPAVGSDTSASAEGDRCTSNDQTASSVKYTRASSSTSELTTSETSTSVSTKQVKTTAPMTPERTTSTAQPTATVTTTFTAETAPTTISVTETTTAPPLTTTSMATNATATPLEITPKPYECATRDCKAISTRLVGMIRRQADPCRFYNTYVCDPSEADFALSQPSVPVVQIGNSNTSSEGGSRAKSAGAASGDTKTTYGALKDLCLAYGDVDDAEIGDALAFLSVLKLNLTGMRDNAEEDPLHRAMQLSLEFGVHSLLNFQRVFEYVVDASEPFRLEISVSAHVRDFVADWVQVNRDVWPKFFEYCLSLCGLPIGSPLNKNLRDQLISLDDEVAYILSARTDPVTKEAFLDSPSAVTIDELAAYTENTVSPDRWRQLLTEHARAEFMVHESVLAYPRALKLADLLSHPRRRFAMRRLVAWHLLLLLLGPKRAVLQAYQDATYDAIKMPGHLPIVAHGFARHVVQDLPEAYMEKWDRYWAQYDMTSINYMYCLHATNNSVDVVPPIARLQERALKGSVLEHLVATRLAFLAFNESPKGSQDQLLPHIDLPPAVLFFVFHCSYSCRRGDSAQLYPRGEDCMVVFRWTSRFTDLIPCGHDTSRQSRAQCRYL
ncbi:uncharacterized protein LOC142574737 [Dermacentor variabilis]|uniref:uncharacterized protein LOC142574737 n=1 Tax=Dermacentor variabilis TaxID=34621 RepID=UPI003F5CA397